MSSQVVGGVRCRTRRVWQGERLARASTTVRRHSSIFLGEVGSAVSRVSQAGGAGDAANWGDDGVHASAVPQRGPRGIEVVGVRTINDLFDIFSTLR